MYSLCVTPALQDTVSKIVQRSKRIGMWIFPVGKTDLLGRGKAESLKNLRHGGEGMRMRVLKGAQPYMRTVPPPAV